MSGVSSPDFDEWGAWRRFRVLAFQPPIWLKWYRFHLEVRFNRRFDERMLEPRFHLEVRFAGDSVNGRSRLDMARVFAAIRRWRVPSDIPFEISVKRGDQATSLCGVLVRMPLGLDMARSGDPPRFGGEVFGFRAATYKVRCGSRWCCICNSAGRALRGSILCD